MPCISLSIINMKRKNLFHYYFAVLVLPVLFAACRKKHDDKPALQPDKDVYAAGRDKYVATYWKNGAAVTLGKGTGGSDANGIAMLGNDIYVAGY